MSSLVTLSQDWIDCACPQPTGQPKVVANSNAISPPEQWLAQRRVVNQPLHWVVNASHNAVFGGKGDAPNLVRWSVTECVQCEQMAQDRNDNRGYPIPAPSRSIHCGGAPPSNEPISFASDRPCHDPHFPPLHPESTIHPFTASALDRDNTLHLELLGRQCRRRHSAAPTASGSPRRGRNSRCDDRSHWLRCTQRIARAPPASH